MKKRLFNVALIATMVMTAGIFASCGGDEENTPIQKNNCTCTIYGSDGTVWVTPTEDGVNGTLDVLAFEGECSNVKWTDLHATWSNTPSILLEAVLKCVEM